jgi:class 3 adenylate cyclase
MSVVDECYLIPSITSVQRSTLDENPASNRASGSMMESLTMLGMAETTRNSGSWHHNRKRPFIGTEIIPSSVKSKYAFPQEENQIIPVQQDLLKTNLEVSANPPVAIALLPSSPLSPISNSRYNSGNQTITLNLKIPTLNISDSAFENPESLTYGRDERLMSPLSTTTIEEVTSDQFQHGLIARYPSSCNTQNKKPVFIPSNGRPTQWPHTNRATTINNSNSVTRILPPSAMIRKNTPPRQSFLEFNSILIDTNTHSNTLSSLQVFFLCTKEKLERWEMYRIFLTILWCTISVLLGFFQDHYWWLIGTFGILLSYASYRKILTELEKVMSRLDIQRKNLQQERKIVESLLLEIYPQNILQRMRAGEQPILDNYPNTTILFTDIVSFTDWSSTLSPYTLASRLNQIYCIFDYFADKFQVYKVETIGDAFMAVCGCPEKVKDHAIRISRFAISLLGVVDELRYLIQKPDFQIRIGLHTGPIAAGIVGSKRHHFHLFGDTVNVASRMESTSIPGRIQLSESTQQELKNTLTLSHRGVIPIKGKGVQSVYWLQLADWLVQNPIQNQNCNNVLQFRSQQEKSYLLMELFIRAGAPAIFQDDFQQLTYKIEGLLLNVTSANIEEAPVQKQTLQRILTMYNKLKDWNLFHRLQSIEVFALYYVVLFFLPDPDEIVGIASEFKIRQDGHNAYRNLSFHLSMPEEIRYTLESTINIYLDMLSRLSQTLQEVHQDFVIVEVALSSTPSVDHKELARCYFNQCFKEGTLFRAGVISLLPIYLFHTSYLTEEQINQFSYILKSV